MISYRPVAYRPRLSQAVVVPAVAPASPIVSVPDAGSGFTEGLFWTAIASAASWAAITTARKTSGFPSIAAWAGGIGAGLAALTGLAGIVAPSAARTLPLRWYF